MSLSKPSDGLPVALQLGVAAASGVVFGIAFDKSRVFQPDVIFDQARCAKGAHAHAHACTPLCTLALTLRALSVCR